MTEQANQGFKALKKFLDECQLINAELEAIKKKYIKLEGTADEYRNTLLRILSTLEGVGDNKDYACMELIKHTLLKNK